MTTRARRTLELLAGLVADGTLRPVIADVMSWRETSTALDRLRARDVLGKLVLTID